MKKLTYCRFSVYSTFIIFAFRHILSDYQSPGYVLYPEKMKHCLVILFLMLIPTFGLVGNNKNEWEQPLSQIAETIGRNTGEWSATRLEWMGDSLYYQQAYDSAAACFAIAALIDNPHPDKATTARIYNKIGHIALLQHNYTKAYSAFIRAIAADDSYENYKARIYLALIYIYFDDYGQALTFLKEAYQDALAIKDYQNLPVIFHNITNLALDHDSLAAESEILYHFESLKDLPDTPLTIYEQDAGKAMICIVNRQYEQAIDLFRNALSHIETTDSLAACRISAIENIGKCLALTGDYAGAIRQLHQANALAAKLGMPENIILNTRLLAEYFQQLGEKDSSLQYEFKYLQLRDSVLSRQSFRHIHDMESAYRTERIENELAQTLNEKRMQTRMLWTATAAFVIMFFFLCLIAKQNRTIRQANRDLFRKNVELMDKHTVAKNPSHNEDIAPDNGTNPPLAHIFKAVSRIMEQSEAVYSPDFSLDQLSQLAGFNSKYVSKAINDIAGKNFRSFLNEYRIREAQRRLLSNRHMFTNEVIGEQVGFRSRSNFIATFKRITGLTPKEYQRQAHLQNDSKTSS